MLPALRWAAAYPIDGTASGCVQTSPVEWGGFQKLGVAGEQGAVKQNAAGPVGEVDLVEVAPGAGGQAVISLKSWVYIGEISRDKIRHGVTGLQQHFLQKQVQFGIHMVGDFPIKIGE